MNRSPLFFLSVFFILLSNTQSLKAQKSYAFNSPGNECYLSYVIFVQNEDYSELKRPHVYIIGKPNQLAHQIFEEDYLKNIPEFHNYKFVYVPNKGGGEYEKLSCFETFVDYNTRHYKCGRNNVFLFSYDKSIKDYNQVTGGEHPVFAKVLEIQNDSDSANFSENLDLITSEFKEDYKAYSSFNKKKNQLGNYYVEEEENSKNLDVEEEKEEVKTFFGSPKTYDFQLYGKIVDKITKEPLSFANVLVQGTNIGATSNENGSFIISGVPSDTITLIVSYVGYPKKKVFLTPFLSKKNLVIELYSQSKILKDVTIIGYKNEIKLAKKEEISQIKLNPIQIEKLPNFGEKDVMRSFQLMPGVSASQESSSGLYVRGGTPDQNLVLYDGFTVYHVDHLYGFFSAFNSNALENVHLYKGGFESKFGGRLSSVTEITGREGNDRKFRIGGDLSLLSLNAFMEIPINKKFTSFFSYRRSYKGPLYDKLFEKLSDYSTATNNTPQNGPPGGGPGRFGQETDVTNFFYDFNAKLGYKISEKDKITYSFFNGNDKIDNSSSFEAPSFGNGNNNFSSNTNDLTKYGNTGTSLIHIHKFSNRLNIKSSISYSNYYSIRDRTQERNVLDSNDNQVNVINGIYEDNDLKDYTLNSGLTWKTDLGEIEMGVFSSNYDIDYSYVQNDTNTVLAIDDQSNLSGVYLQDKIRFINGRLQIVPGLRISNYQETNKMYYEPRISFALNLTDLITFKGAYGKYYQFINRVTREDLLSGSREFWVLSDGEVIPISSCLQYIGGISYETSQYVFGIEGYYKLLSDLNEYTLRYNVNTGSARLNENFHSGKGYSKGIEFLAQKKGGKLNGWISYTLGEAKNKFDIYSDQYYSANQDVTNEFKIVGMYNLKRWDFSATWVFASGRPYTAPSGAYTVDLLDGNSTEYYTVTSKNSLRLPDYHRSDISLKYKLLAGSRGDKRRREIGYIGFSIFNIYNHINIWYKTYSIEDGSLIETNVNYTGITPNLSLTLKSW